jgi:hypothetical protein
VRSYGYEQRKSADKGCDVKCARGTVSLAYSGPAGANVILEELAAGTENYQWLQGAPQSADSSHPWNAKGDIHHFSWERECPLPKSI